MKPIDQTIVSDWNSILSGKIISELGFEVAGDQRTVRLSEARISVMSIVSAHVPDERTIPTPGWPLFVLGEVNVRRDVVAVRVDEIVIVFAPVNTFEPCITGRIVQLPVPAKLGTE